MHKHNAFTIVELLIVIIVIGILAAVVVISYNGITDQARASEAKDQLARLGVKAETYKIQNSDSYSSSLSDLGVNNGAITYSGGGTSYCASMSANGTSYYISNTQPTPTMGSCTVTIGDGSFIQDINSTNCPATRARAVDARDNHTYWVKAAGLVCEMLTNLAYAGGGVNTYSDTKSLSNGTSDTYVTYTDPKYYIPTSGSNVTTEPTSPSTSTTGTGQYGYLYNWCGAMGGQATAACANATTPSVDTTISICPSGWRLPTGGVGGDFVSISGGATNSDAVLRSTWLAQRSGGWNASGFSNQGTTGYYWSSTPYSATNADSMLFTASQVLATTNSTKTGGFAVRCIIYSAT